MSRPYQFLRANLSKQMIKIYQDVNASNIFKVIAASYATIQGIHPRSSFREAKKTSEEQLPAVIHKYARALNYGFLLESAWDKVKAQICFKIFDQLICKTFSSLFSEEIVVSSDFEPECFCEDCVRMEFDVIEDVLLELDSSLSIDFEFPVIAAKESKKIRFSAKGRFPYSQNPFKILELRCSATKPEIMTKLLQRMRESPKNMSELRLIQSSLFEKNRSNLFRFLYSLRTPIKVDLNGSTESEKKDLHRIEPNLSKSGAQDANQL